MTIALIKAIALLLSLQTIGQTQYFKLLHRTTAPFFLFKLIAIILLLLLRKFGTLENETSASINHKNTLILFYSL